MRKREPYLRGQIHLLAEGGRKQGIGHEYWAHANIKGLQRKDSFGVYLKDKKELSLGETCKADFVFLFREDERFEIEINEGDVFDLKEGARKVGEFIVVEILNEKLKNTHNKT